MPQLKRLSCELDDPDADILQISLGLRHTGASLTHIHLQYQSSTRWCKVSDRVMESLCEAIRDRAPCLEEIVLEKMWLSFKYAMKFIETFRAITTMREIT